MTATAIRTKETKMKEVKKVKHVILGVHITDRAIHVPKVQDLLTQYGCSIKTRLGLHAASDEFCSPNGLILLEMAGPEGPIDELVKKLRALEGVEVQKMVFEHE
jgi:ACT domain-containing protein